MIDPSESAPISGGGAFKYGWWAVALIAVVTGFLFLPSRTGRTDGAGYAQHIKTSALLRVMAQTLNNYALDNRGVFPASGAEATRLIRDTGDTKVDAALDEMLAENGVLYCPPRRGLLNASQVLLMENPGKGHGVNVVYGDLHVELVPREEAQQLKASRGELQVLGR